jgi:ATP-dependent protease HslVU (ClpYQ) ATPase subunit
MESQAQDAKEVGINYLWLVLDTIRRMRDAQAQGRLDEYYTQFEYALQLLLPHIEIETRANIEDDFATLQEKLNAIKETEENEQTLKVKLQAVKCDFADRHRYFIMEALPRASIYKVSDEGVLDFNKHKLEELTEIVRNSGGLASTVARATGKVISNGSDKVEG